jgi:hypothetical protein
MESLFDRNIARIFPRSVFPWSHTHRNGGLTCRDEHQALAEPMHALRLAHIMQPNRLKANLRHPIGPNYSIIARGTFPRVRDSRDKSCLPSARHCRHVSHAVAQCFQTVTRK